MKNLIAYFSAFIFVVSMIFGAGKLIAESNETKKKVEVIEKKVEKLEDEGSKEIAEIKKENNETQKVVIEQSVKIDYIQKVIEKLDRKLEEEQKKEKKK